MNCVLCGSRSSKQIGTGNRKFFLCSECKLVFVATGERVSISEEQCRYDLHQNTRENPGYVRFLCDIVSVVDGMNLHSPRILDFGSGKEAVLTSILNERGYDCTPYDPLYGYPLTEQGHLFDVIILCEVIEHLRDLPSEIQLLRRIIHQSGSVIIRTQLYDSPEAIARWWYAQDCTHINFFTFVSLKRVALLLGKTLFHTSYKDIFLFS